MTRPKSDKPKPYVPPDAAEINRFLDYVARLMAYDRRDAHLCLPIWRALTRELKKAEEAEAMLADAQARLTRSTDRTPARFS